MSPAQPEVHRSGRTPLDPDHADTQVEVEHRAPRDEPGGGPVPEDNRPGHHPDHEQDKPDLDEFAAKFGTAPSEEGGDEPGDGSESATDREAASTSPVDRGRSALETAASVVSGGISAGAAVAGPLVSGARGLVERLAEKKRHSDTSSSEGDADRIARLESRVADLERQLRER
ncbi:hypothetical protein [Actinomarinicola tropica]|uniref:Uncharacterized protein n=1 Tax=Actinomarinicola tropica TaxID=2789776 RepID=A0A5Q2RMT9_9ACTN|nr:hypothetical protein [Actinomarinicola tropica]QGG95891.1 hypothetical protein GH723_12735 [Actinomarinicola tropica]